MVRKAESVGTKRVQRRKRRVATAMVCLLVGLCVWMEAQATMPQAQTEYALSKGDAMTVLRQVETGLVNHNPRIMLNAFDLARMTDGRVFQQETFSFFDLTARIRVHFNLLQTAMDGARGVADVNMEMEAEMRDDRLPVVHKQAQLHLVFEKSGGGWRIVDITPRDFFSTQP